MTETPTHTPLPAISRGPTDELIPCPAGHTGTTRNNNNIYSTWWVQCCKCSWRMAGDTEAEAIAAWNTRADSHHRLVEAAQAMLPRNLNLADWLDDSAVIPMDVTVSELRELSAALKEARHG